MLLRISGIVGKPNPNKKFLVKNQGISLSNDFEDYDCLVSKNQELPPGFSGETVKVWQIQEFIGETLIREPSGTQRKGESQCQWTKARA